MRVSNIADVTATTVPGAGRLWRFIGYYGMSEIAQRVTRLVTTVLVARMLTPLDLGVAAAAITCFELFRVVVNAGVGQAVIRASAATLAAQCATAHRVMWIVCGASAAVQTSAGVELAAWTGRPELGGMIAALAAVYLMMPAALIPCYLLQRENRHGTIATVATAQAVADNVLTILLALAGFGAWAIVLPKVVTCPIWVISMRRAHRWTRDPLTVPAPAREMIRFAWPVVAAELLTAARLQLDKVIVGAMLGVEALGIYTFVFNAGIGLSLSVTSALSNALYPHFAAVAGDRRALLARLDGSLTRTAAPLAGVIVLQAVLAASYVPLLFGVKWSAMAWLVAVLCASAAAKCFSDAGAQALRAAGATGVELQGTLAITAMSLLGLTIGLEHGLASGVVALAVCSGVTQLAFAWGARMWLEMESKADAMTAGVAP